MAILPGEGEHLILYGSFDLPAGTRTHTGYLARPDVVGSFPTVLVVHDIFGLTSHEKEVCRRLARHGITAVAIDLYREGAPGRRARLEEALDAYRELSDSRALADLEDAFNFVMNKDIPGTQKEGLGVLGLDVGGRLALLFAARHRRVGAVAVCYAPLTGQTGGRRGPQPMEVLPEVTAPILGLYGGDDDLVDVREVRKAQQLAPHGEWIVYDGAGYDFLNEGREGYDHPIADDALGRVICFFRSHLPAAELVPVG